MPQIYHYALLNACRLGATRLGYVSPSVFVSVNGVQYATARPVDANKVLDGSLTITEVLNEIPNTASLTMQGVEPSEGQEVIVTLGSIHNLDRLYAGLVLSRTHNYTGTPANWSASVSAIDYTWHLTRRRVSGIWTSTSATDIANTLIASVPGFTSSGVVAGLPILDTFSVTDVDVLSALTQLAKRIGGYCDVTYQKGVKLFLSDTSVTNPTDLTETHPTLSEFSFSYDLSQVRTRIFSEGGGVNALGPCAVGETILPVESTVWYNPAGGLVKSGSQHLTYTGLVAGGSGSLVGPGATPSAALNAAAVLGAGLTTGNYTYAYTDVTAAGESLPSPLRTIAVGPFSVPSTKLTAWQSTALTGPTGYYGYAYTTVDSAGVESTDCGRDVGSTVFYSNGTNNRFNSIVPFGPTGTVARKIYRTPTQVSAANAVSAGLQYCGVLTDNVSTNFFENVTTDAGLGAAPPIGGNQVALSAIAIGATGTTSRKVYRTVVNGSQLKLQQTIADNTSTAGVQDATADGSLGANVPTSDTSGLTQPSGQILAGATTLLVAGAGAFSSGWAIIGNGKQSIRYTGVNGNTLTGIPASGVGSITATISYNSTVTAAPALLGIPASGAGSILYPILQGDAVNVLVQCDDLAAQSALAALIGGGDDGIVEEFIQDGRVSGTEALARGVAQLALSSTARVSIRYKVRDTNTHVGRTIHVDLPSPTSLTADFKIQQVTISDFAPALLPTYTVQASSSRFSLDDLLRLARGV